MSHDAYDDTFLRDVLNHSRRIALVGASANPARPSHGVMAFLLHHGREVIPVNPGLAGQKLLGQSVVASVKDIKGQVDMIDVFRNSAEVPTLLKDVFAMEPQPRFIWMQIGVRDDICAAAAEAKGIKVVMNRCPAIEMPRLGIK